MQEPQIQQIEPKKSKKLFAVIFVISIILNLILIVKIINPEINITGSATLINPQINPDLEDNLNPSDSILHYTELKENIHSQIKEQEIGNKIAFFIQDLQTGAWTGWREREGFAPASLLKVPIMIAILKKADRGEISLSDKILMRKEYIDIGYQTPYEGKEGQEFTIEHLLRSMITESDNTAKNALVRQLLAYEIDDLFKHVGVPNPYSPENKNKTVSTRDYSRFFKSLYHSTYLSAKNSQFALDLTTGTQVENLLPEGVPDDIIVAHKFGIYDENVLHDCGIVYHETNPYSICIMTKDLQSTKSAELIRSISKSTYDFVDSRQLSD